MSCISSSVFSDSLSGWAIEKTKTINDGLSEGKARALTLAVTVLVLPIFAVLDLVFVPCESSRLALVPVLFASKLTSSIAFIVQLPLLILANLFGANLLPKVNYNNMRIDINRYGSELRLKAEIEKFKLAINQYKHGECSFEEFIANREQFRKCISGNEHHSSYLFLEPFPLQEHLHHCLGMIDAPKHLVDRLLEKPNREILSGFREILSGLAKDMHQVLDQTCFVRMIGRGVSNGFHREQEEKRNFQAAMLVMGHLDQPFSQGTKDFLIQNLPQIYRLIPDEFTKNILDYVKRSEDIEFGQAIIIRLKEEATSPQHSPERFQGILSALSDMIKEQTAKRAAEVTVEVRGRTPLKLPGVAELIAGY